MKTKQSAKPEQRKESRKILTAEEHEQIKAKLSIMEEILILCPKALRTVSDLIRLAKGEVARGEIGLATECLLCFTTDLVFALDELASDRPELFQPLARKEFAWPVMIYGKKALNRTQ